jgi:hypothetical protein
MTCPTEPQEHRGSRMPELLKSLMVDPLFADAVASDVPEEALREKAAGGGR